MNELQRLANELETLTKAYLLALAICGPAADSDPGPVLNADSSLLVDKSAMRSRINGLRERFGAVAEKLFLDWKPTDLEKAVAWLAPRFDAWRAEKMGIFNLCRVFEFEEALGTLGFKRVMDCPPYAQMVLQGFAAGAGIRFPEYHAATDLALAYDLYLDSEAIIEDLRVKQLPRSSEYSQSLGRIAILSCFNLLETFVSGLAADYLMRHPEAPAEKVKLLQHNNPTLKERFRNVPAAILDNPNWMDFDKPPYEPLFGEYSRRRNSFVHCEPHLERNAARQFKERHFHDINLVTVRAAVDLTLEAICATWKSVHGRERPSWLPKKDASGRFPLINVALTSASPQQAD